MSEENLEIVRRSLELYNALGRTGDAFVDPEGVGPRALVAGSPPVLNFTNVLGYLTRWGMG